MARTNTIRWRNQDIVKLRKTVSKFNAKLTRLIKAHPEFADFLPSRLSVKNARENITTRNDFNRFIASHERFMIKGAERPIMSKSGVMSTVWEHNEVKRNIALINRRRKAQLKKINPSPYKGNMGTIEHNNLRPIKDRFDDLPSKVWKQFIAQVEKQTREDYFVEKCVLYQNNYLKALYVNLGDYAEKIAQRVLKIDPIKFFEISMDNFDTLSIDFPYDELEMIIKVDEILGRLEALGY